MGLRELLFGTQKIDEGELQPQYGEQIQAYLDSLENQEYFKNLLNRPNQTGLTPEQYKIGITQGLNYGVPEIAQAQQQLGINIPQTGEDKYNASIGEFNKYPMIRTGISGGPREGGLLNDFSRGYNENYNNKFTFDNLAPQGKNLATKIGEGLGSVGRFIDSPLGRGLIAGGLNAALGYNDSLKEGLNAYVGRQNAQTADRLYRNQLKQFGFSDDELKQINGNITNDMYKNIISNMWRYRNLDQNTYVKMKTLYDRQLQQGILTPDEYKTNVDALNNQYINSQIQTMNAGKVGESNQTKNTRINEKLLPYKQQALMLAPQISLGNLGVAQGNLALNNQRLQHQIEQDAFENQFKEKNSPMGSLTAIKNQMDRFSKSFENVSKGKGGAIASELKTSAGFGNQAEVNFNSQKQLLFNKIARDLGGEKGVLSDQDIQRIKEALPNLSDSYAQKRAKMKAVYSLLDDRMSQYGGGSNKGKDPLGIR